MSMPTKVMGTRLSGGPRLEFTGLSRAQLIEQLDRELEGKVHGLCFSAYLDGQGPEKKTQLPPAQTRARMEIIQPYCRWIRTFSCQDGNQASPAIAHQLGLKTLVGAWIGDDPAINEKELAGIIEVARAGHADIVAVGNEVLLRGDLTEDQLLACIRRVKQALPGATVGYVDAYYVFAEHPRLVEACDLLLINCYPFWEKSSLEVSLAHLQEMVSRARAVAGGKKIVISETGWPSAGQEVGEAVPSVENALIYALNTFKWTQREGLDLFYFSSFDEEWKAGPEGGCGPHWGFWDRQGKRKYVR
jgi:exo-beta-1,3-glucanase (GH17 family)